MATTRKPLTREEIWDLEDQHCLLIGTPSGVTTKLLSAADKNLKVGKTNLASKAAPAKRMTVCKQKP